MTIASSTQTKSVKRSFPSVMRRGSSRQTARAITQKAIMRRRGLAPTFRGFVPLNALMRGQGRGIRGETKGVDLPFASYVLNTTGSVTGINFIRTGSSFTNRIGRKIAMTRLHIKGAIAQGASDTDQVVRYAIVYDKQANGAAPTWANVFTDYDQATTATSDASSGINLDFRDRFIVLLDQYLHLPATSAASIDAAFTPNAREVTIEHHINMRRLECQYKADSAPAVVGDIATGALYLMTFGNAVGAAGASLNATIRLRFQDN